MNQVKIDKIPFLQNNEKEKGIFIQDRRIIKTETRGTAFLRAKRGENRVCRMSRMRKGKSVQARKVRSECPGFFILCVCADFEFYKFIAKGVRVCDKCLLYCKRRKTKRNAMFCYAIL